MPLAASSLSCLYQALSDAESGTPRQWLYLELAAACSPLTPPGRGVLLLAWFIRQGGVSLAWPILEGLHLPGLAPYRPLPGISSARCARGGALVGATLIAGLCSLSALPATRQWLLVLLMVLGAGLMAGISGLISRRQILLQRREANRVMAELTPAESALGLSGLLVSAGKPLDEAAKMVAMLRQAPDVALDRETCRLLGLDAPVWTAVLGSACLAGLAWSGGVIAVGWGCWLPGSSMVPWLIACFGVGLLAYVLQEPAGRWGRSALIDILAASLGGGVVWLLRILPF